MSQKFRFHVLGLPHTVTSKEFIACAYTQKVWKFCKMMGERGHTVYHYGHELSDPPHVINVPVIDNEVWQRVYGTHDYKSKFFTYDVNDEAYRTFYANAIERIGERAQPNDFVLYSWGGAGCNMPIVNKFPWLLHVEPGIGYAGGHFAPFKAFESYAIYHAYCGLGAVSNCKQNNYEVVIPNYFDPDDFEYSDQKEDYFLFLGRVYEGKGVHIAHQVCEHLGVKLKIAGQLPDGELPDYIKNSEYCEFVGYADAEKRKNLMKGAMGSFVASQYIEPFGGVQVENLLSGTPTITTDWGAFVENNVHGVTGYRCRTFDDFLQAAINIMEGKIRSEDCRKKGEDFLLDNVAPQFEKFFQDIMNIRTGKGWYETTVEQADIQINDNFDYDNIDNEEKPFADNLAKWIKDNFDVSDVVDMGCGPGTYVYSLRDQGINCHGYDIHPVVENKEHLTKMSMFDVDHPADMIICLEVAEHIPTKMNDEIVQSLYRNLKDGGILIFSAARPGQGGVGHINCQPREYWENKFEQAGLTRMYDKEQDIDSYLVGGNRYRMGWFVNNRIIFKKFSSKK